MMTFAPVDIPTDPRAFADEPRYDGVWKAIHWLMAALFLTNVALGYWASTLHGGASPRPQILGVHKSIGVTLFALILLRVFWRFTHRHPPLPARFGGATRFVSSAVHFTLYLLMLGMPMSGYVASIAGGYPTSWFGLFPIPSILPKDKALSELGDQIHGLGAYAVYALVSLHILGAAWHGLRRDGVMGRMVLPRG